MRIFKKVGCTLLAIMLVVVFAFSCYTSYQQKTGGGYSTLATITEESRDWILEQFGHCQSVPELIVEIDRFGCANFVYEFLPFQIIQDFRLDRFLFEDDFHGVCFDFSCFVKCVVLVWSEFHQRQDVAVFVYDVTLPNGGKHSYNFIQEDGHTWFLCLTSNVTRTAQGKESWGYDEVKDMSIRQYMDLYDEVMYNMN